MAKPADFTWDSSRITIPQLHSVDRACFKFHRDISEFVWEASFLEGLPFTFAEVKTLIDGVTVGGRRIDHHDRVIKIINAARETRGALKSGSFIVPDYCNINEDRLPPFIAGCDFFLRSAMLNYFGFGLGVCLVNLNGYLMSRGFDYVSVPHTLAPNFHAGINRLHKTNDATEMMVFLAACCKS